MARFVCIHGHFYQPPRENAWLERIDRQESAHPFHDWNARIDAECYRPNARARIIDGDDRITKIVNNYARISFNVGPTLLAWLESRAARTYQGILEADRISIAKLGRGSAMAQAYGHLIMPLANARDKATQVRWGMRDFSSRFDRAPEGMWLPETAACTESLQVLADEGILFTILAPAQAAATRLAGEETFVPTSERALDPRRPYRVELAGGRSIAVFFYDGATSQSVAFERLLSNGDAFASRLLGAFSKEPKGDELVSIATDGETYGHHHRFGEMALAYALERIERDPRTELTNYAAYLAAHPPTAEAKIVESSAWSCAHGVGRWSRDCGCRTRMDSSQAWRGPLRDALDRLRDGIDQAYERAAEPLLSDPWVARDDYVSVLLDRSPSSIEAFLENHARSDLSAAERERSLSLLEMQRHRMQMFTSCGWFFDDVEGLETTQILQYAARAVELCERATGTDLRAHVLSDLEAARAHTHGSKSGREVYERAAVSGHVDLARAAETFAVTSLFGVANTVEMPAFRLEESELHVARKDDVRVAAGRIAVMSNITTETRELAFAVLHTGGPAIEGGLSPEADAPNGEALLRTFEDEGVEAVRARIQAGFPLGVGPLRALPLDERVMVVERIVADAVRSAESSYRAVFVENAALLSELARAGVRPPRALTVATRVVLEADLLRAVRRDPTDTRAIRNLLAEAKNENVHFDEAAFGYELSAAIDRACDILAVDPADDGTLGRLDDMIYIARRFSASFDLSRAQDLAWSVVREPTELARTASARGRLGAWRELAKTLRIKLEH